MFHFTLTNTDAKSQARTGILTTAHGPIHTPAFMPVGTVASVKGLTISDLHATGSQCILANTYHLMLRPGIERVAGLGGVRKMMGWEGALLTDSGGFQAMSLKGLRQIDDDGIDFTSHLDGSRHRLTPETATEMQHALDATISMVLDECTPHPATKAEAATSMRRSMAWAERSRMAFRPRAGYAQFGIVQGSIYPELRKESAQHLTSMDFDGLAIGGLAVGEGQQAMFATLECTTPHLPKTKPRYLMGVGKPDDIVGAVARGVDMFDCVLPTRSGRTGQGFTKRGTVNLLNARHADDPRPLEDSCDCPGCVNHTRAYLHHLFKANEVLGLMLLTYHNVRYYQRLMAEIRTSIDQGTFDAFRQAFHAEYTRGDIAPR